VQSQRTADANYSIRLELSAGTQPAISVNAPLGGLRLAARDVNGDDTVDLIVTSVLDHRVVVVLLNDGHGRFSMAQVDAYALAGEGDAFLCQREGTLGDRITLAQARPTFDGEYSKVGEEIASPSMDSVPAGEGAAVFSPSQYVRFGRSPPCAALLV